MRRISWSGLIPPVLPPALKCGFLGGRSGGINPLSGRLLLLLAIIGTTTTSLRWLFLDAAGGNKPPDSTATNAAFELLKKKQKTNVCGK